MHSLAGGSLKLTAGSGKQVNGHGGHIVLQGGSNFAISAGRNNFRLQDPRDKSSCDIMILKRGSLKDISVSDSLSKFKLNLIPSFESGFKEFKVYTNSSNVMLNTTSNYGSCKVLKDSTLLSQKCLNVSLKPLQYGINRFILAFSRWKIYHKYLSWR